MTRVNVRETIEAPADSVWALVGDFGGLARIGLVPKCEVEGEGVGAVRTIEMGDARIRERLEAYDGTGRLLSYSIVDAGPLPVKDYEATIRVIDDGSERCIVDWSGSFEPTGDEAEAIRAIEDIYNGGIQGLKRAVED